MRPSHATTANIACLARMVWTYLPSSYIIIKSRQKTDCPSRHAMKITRNTAGNSSSDTTVLYPSCVRRNIASDAEDVSHTVRNALISPRRWKRWTALSSSSSRVMPSKQTVRRISQERYIYYHSRKNLCRFPAIFFVSSRVKMR